MCDLMRYCEILGDLLALEVCAEDDSQLLPRQVLAYLEKTAEL